MRDVIEQIIETEGEAKLKVETARNEAERIVSEARKKAYDVVEGSRQEAIGEAEKII